MALEFLEPLEIEFLVVPVVLTEEFVQGPFAPMFSHRHLQYALEEHLTERQHEVLEAAHEAGYYDWPRDTTGEVIADDLGISSATFHQHLRAAEQKLIAISLG